MTVADRIKNRREELQLSQEELALRLGLKGRSSVSKAEKSGNTMTLKTVEAYAKALMCSPEYLMGWEEAPRTHETGFMAASLIKDNEVLERAYKLHLASEDDRKYIFKIIDSILGD